jgi:dihydrofolate reductase
MRKIIVAGFVSLDGVMQAPGTPTEDPTGGFEHGGWLVPLMDDVAGAAIGELFETPFDLLLGRRTYDIFAAHWPEIAKDPKAEDAELGKLFDKVTKYVATHRPESLAWQKSKALGNDAVVALRALKKEDGPPLLTQGSSDLVHQLLANDLVDELRLFVFPVVLGNGKRLLGQESKPRTFELTSSKVSPSGIVVASYARAGEVKTGSFHVPEPPSAAELSRRAHLHS